jgi:hypothetical protein
MEDLPTRMSAWVNGLGNKVRLFNENPPTIFSCISHFLEYFFPLRKMHEHVASMHKIKNGAFEIRAMPDFG